MGMLGIALAFAAGLLIVYIICKILSVPLKIIWRLVVNALIGAGILFLFNLFGGLVGITLPINTLNALVVGVLGIPGVILLLVLKLIL